MFRFQLRSLLIGTALVGLFLGLQIHVHTKAKRFKEKVNRLTNATVSQLMDDVGCSKNCSIMSNGGLEDLATIAPTSFWDNALCRRRCIVRFSVTWPTSDGTRLIRDYKLVYSFPIRGENLDRVSFEESATLQFPRISR